MIKKLLSVSFIVLTAFLTANAQLTLVSSFNPTSTSALCGLGYDPDSGHVWIYGCSDGTIQCHNDTGAFLYSVPVAGGTANDVDVEIAPVALMMNGNAVPKGQLLFINGESGVAEIYAMDNATGAVLDTLVTTFGADHVVGGGYHPVRNTFFLLQDNVPGAADENLVAEIDPLDGDTLQVFQITPFFDVYYGDIAAGANGNLYIVSSDEDSIAEVTPQGTLIQMLGLPAGVTDLSGIALDCATGQAWVSGNGGMVYRLGNFPCGGTGISELSPESFDLGVPSPNPMSDGATFTMNVNQSGNYRISVADLDGKGTVVIYEGKLASGQHTFSVPGRNLANGIYLLKATGAEKEVVKKMVVIRN